MGGKVKPTANKESFSNYLLTAYEGRDSDSFYIGFDPFFTKNNPAFAKARVTLADICYQKCKACRSEVTTDDNGALVVLGDRPRAPKKCQLNGKHLRVKMDIDTLVD